MLSKHVYGDICERHYWPDARKHVQPLNTPRPTEGPSDGTLERTLDMEGTPGTNVLTIHLTNQMGLFGGTDPNLYSKVSGGNATVVGFT